MSSSPHFAVICSCGQGCAMALDAQQAELCARDPAIFLRSLPEEVQETIMRFYVHHQGLGHAPAPQLCDMEPLPEA